MKNIVAIMLLTASIPAAASSQVIDEGIGKARQLIYQGDGWSVFRARNGQFYSCFAYKLTEGEPATAITPTGSGMALGMIGGLTRGFKIYISDDANKYEYGFFGKESYVGTTALEANGKIYTAIYSFGDLKFPQLLELDGARSEVEINSYEYRSRIGDKDFYSGYLDLTGLKAAHSALDKCHKDKPAI